MPKSLFRLGTPTKYNPTLPIIFYPLDCCIKEQGDSKGKPREKENVSASDRNNNTAFVYPQPSQPTNQPKSPIKKHFKKSVQNFWPWKKCRKEKRTALRKRSGQPVNQPTFTTTHHQTKRKEKRKLLPANQPKPKKKGHRSYSYPHEQTSTSTTAFSLPGLFLFLILILFLADSSSSQQTNKKLVHNLQSAFSEARRIGGIRSALKLSSALSGIRLVHGRDLARNGGPFHLAAQRAAAALALEFFPFEEFVSMKVVRS